MKKAITLLTALLLAAVLVLPLPAAARGNAASEARNGVVRIVNVVDGSSSYGIGSGVAVGEAGEPTDIFVTNNHVIDGADKIYIALDNQWQESVPHFGGTEDGDHAVRCEVVSTPGADPDYAILRSTREVSERVAQPLMHAQEAVPAEQIYALGYPGISDSITGDSHNSSVDDVTVTSGTISRFVTEAATDVKYIQIDADINPGNSGGPLITEDGYVIGLNTKYYQDIAHADISRKVYLSLEIDYVINELNNLIDDGTLSDFTFTVEGVPVDDEKTSKPLPDEDEEEEKEDKKDKKKDKKDKHEDTKKKTDIDEDRENDEPEDDSNMIIIVGVVAGVAALIAAALYLKKRKEQQQTPVSYQRSTPPQAPDQHNGNQNQAQSSGVQVQQVIAGQPVGGSDDIGFETVPANVGKHIVHHSSEASFCLMGVEGHFAGRKIPVDKDLYLGRKPGSDILFPANTPGVSSAHCLISPRPNGVVVMDLGSTYGTHTPTGTKLVPNQKYLMKAGDSIQIGNARQTFRVVPVGGASTPSIPNCGGAPNAATLYVTCLSGPLTGRRFPVNKALRFGRGGANDIVFPEGTPGISSSHCVLNPQGNMLYLSDLGSSYGTFLENGAKLAPQDKHPMKKGDIFYLASKGNSFRID